ncbi:MAG: SusC/RagA family TonB-linked outer membrane protein [Bacteroidales bacterium]|nr:SusC/RagA family TonB-linked outer membrane protein [Bacteroidales bacterium]
MKNYIKALALVATVLVSIFSVEAQAQAQDNSEYTWIEGRVFDQATDSVVLGATIKMNDVAVFTNEKGMYKLRIKQPTSYFTVSAPGYDTRVIEWRGRARVDVALSSNTFSKPYGSPLEYALVNDELISEGSAYSQLENLQKIAPQYTIDQLIQNQMGTVRSTQRSGKDGIGSVMYIRGINSINTNSQPLVIVDGIIMESYNDLESLHAGFYHNFLNHIPLYDIENITVIKDATSLYGSKAANGVILIETKRGHSMATKIVADVAMGQTMEPNRIPTLNTAENRLLISELYKNTLFSPIDVNAMPMFNENENYVYYLKYHNNTDWGKDIYRNGFNQSYSARATGGDDRGMYALSVGYSNNSGVVEGTNTSHISFRFNSDMNIAKNITSVVDFSISSISNDLFNDGMTSRTSPTYLAAVKSPMFAPYQYSYLTKTLTNNLETYDDLAINNPAAIMSLAQQVTDMTNFTAVAKPKWQINDHFAFNAVAAYTLNKVFESYFTPSQGVAPEVVYKEDGTFASYTSEAKAQNLREIRTHLESNLNYRRAFGDHALSATGGFRFLLNNKVWDYVAGYNTPNDTQVDVSGSLKRKVTDGASINLKNIAWYANADWNYLQKYFLSANVTMEACSRFGTDIEKGALKLFGVNWAVFPSLSGAWLLSAEDFMADVTAIDQLKLRSSIGFVGNDKLEDYVTYSYFSSETFYNKANGLVLANIGNQGLKWETTRKANLGFDLSLFGNRFSMSADVYDHHTKDLLCLKQLSEVSGFKNYWANDGSLRNRGFEVAMNARLLNTSNWRWEATATVAHNKNEILSLADGNYTTNAFDAEILTAEGGPVAQFYGYNYLGVYSDQAEVDAYNNLKMLNENGTYSYFAPGDAIFEDVVPDGIIDEKDKQVIGNPNPDFTGILSSSLSYKNVSLSATLGYSLGNDVYNYQRRILESMSTFENQSTAVLNRWRSSGDETNIPRAVYGDPMGNARFSSRWVEDASYLRLKNVSLSWDLPYKIPFINAMTIWASANNLWTWSSYLGCDPESSASNNVLYQGIDTGLLPQSASYTVGVRINL